MSLAMILGGAEKMLYVAGPWHPGIPEAARRVAIDDPAIDDPMAGRPSPGRWNLGWSSHWKAGVVSVTRSK
jgi:hypothetical protein